MKEWYQYDVLTTSIEIHSTGEACIILSVFYKYSVFIRSTVKNIRTMFKCQQSMNDSRRRLHADKTFFYFVLLRTIKIKTQYGGSLSP